MATEPDDDDILRYVNASIARGDGNEGSTAVRHYKKWSAGRGDACLRPLDPMASSLAQKTREMVRIARFASFLVQVQGVSAKSASAYISTVNAWHLRRAQVGLAAGAPLSISAAFLKGWARSHPPPRGVYQRIGITPQHLAAGMDRVLGRRSVCGAANQNVRACLVVAFAGLLRTCEICFQDGKKEAFQAIPSRKLCDRLQNGSRRIFIREAKRTTLDGIAPCASTPILFYPGGKLLDAVAEIQALMECDPAAEDAPLFRNPVTNRPLRVSFIRDMVNRR